VRNKTVKILGIILLINMIFSLSVGIAVYLRANSNPLNFTYPSTVTIILAPNLVLYSGSACSGTPISSISFPQVVQGGTSSVTVAIENTGGTTLTFFANSTSSTLPSSVGSLTSTLAQSGTVSLAPNGCQSFVLTLVTSPSAPVGTANFDLTITAY
jgi:hypothetical protein